MKRQRADFLIKWEAQEKQKREQRADQLFASFGRFVFLFLIVMSILIIGGLLVN
jgi:hypothetical protein